MRKFPILLFKSLSMKYSLSERDSIITTQNRKNSENFIKRCIH
jgi:hypothetical protein